MRVLILRSTRYRRVNSKIFRRFPSIPALGLTVLLMPGCITIANPKHPVELTPAQVIPVLPEATQAPKNAMPVAMIRPRDLRSSQEVTQFKTPVLPPLPLASSVALRHERARSLNPAKRFSIAPTTRKLKKAAGV